MPSGVARVGFLQELPGRTHFRETFHAEIVRDEIPRQCVEQSRGLAMRMPNVKMNQ
jgi:hypothetical protein